MREEEEERETQWEFFHSICEIKFFDFISMISGGLLLGSRIRLTVHTSFIHFIYCAFIYAAAAANWRKLNFLLMN